DPEPETRGDQSPQRSRQQQEIDRAEVVSRERDHEAGRDGAEGEDQERLPGGSELHVASSPESSGSGSSGAGRARRLGSSGAATRNRASGAVRAGGAPGGRGG